MASDISDDDDGYPWLSWARTGVLTLAGVLVLGLVVSAINPPEQSAPGQVAPARPGPARSGTADVAKLPDRAPATAAAPPATPASVPDASPAVVESSPPAVESVAQEMSTPAVEAVPVPPMPPEPAKSNLAPEVLPPSAPVAPQGQPRKADVPVTVTPEPPVVKPESAAQDATKQAAFGRAVAGARAAMGQRNLAAAKQHLQTAAANAQGPADQAELERLQALQDHLEQFWEGIRKAVAAMQPLDEIILSESNRVAVIEASRTELAVQREGRPRRSRIEAIPMDLLWAIANQSFKPTAGSKLIVGSFLAMDGQGNRAQAEKFWQEAIRGGESQGTLLLPELKAPQAGRRKP